METQIRAQVPQFGTRPHTQFLHRFMQHCNFKEIHLLEFFSSLNCTVFILNFLFFFYKSVVK